MATFFLLTALFVIFMQTIQYRIKKNKIKNARFVFAQHSKGECVCASAEWHFIMIHAIWSAIFFFQTFSLVILNRRYRKPMLHSSSLHYVLRRESECVYNCDDDGGTTKKTK